MTTEAQRSRRHKNKQYYLGVLGGRCVKCFSEEDLEFDHIDPGSVSFRISQGLNYRKERVLGELEKCQLLCTQCHILKSVSERVAHSLETHGSPSTYTNHKCRCALCTDAWAAYLRARRHCAKINLV